MVLPGVIIDPRQWLRKTWQQFWLWLLVAWNFNESK